VFPEFASIWRDPFEIKRKATDVLYEIDCDKNEQTQTVHCISSRHFDKKIVRNRQEMA
jgi:hypothetical protein